MMDENPDFSEFIEALNRSRVEYVVVGSFVLAFLGSPRATGDIDIWIRPTVANADALIRAIENFGLKSLGITREDILSDKIVQIGVAPVRIDLITALDGLTSDEIWSSRRKGPFGRHEVHYLGKEAFVKNKRAAGRPKDLADLDALGEPPASAA